MRGKSRLELATDMAAREVKQGVPFREAVGHAAYAYDVGFMKIQSVMTQRSMIARRARQQNKLKQLPSMFDDSKTERNNA